MNDETARELLELNRRFYTDFGSAFAATRRRVQPGVRRVLEGISADETADWLDLGCGSGALGCLWAEQGRRGSYTGLDFSGPLLTEARTATATRSNEQLTLDYVPGDLMDPGWPDTVKGQSFDGVFAFASLHHIPGRENHLRIFRQVRALLRSGGRFILSVWQFQNSPKLMKRVQLWSAAGMDEARLEPGDTLLDWRYALPENGDKHGLRYVHLFSEDELRRIAADAGFTLGDVFYSDGAEGNLALYMKLNASG